MEEIKCTTEHAIALCVKIEAHCPAIGYHVALTGGCLYKGGERKDIDILFYKIRGFVSADQDIFSGSNDQDLLFDFLERIGLRIFSREKNDFFVYKGEYKGIDVDIFFPENHYGEY